MSKYFDEVKKTMSLAYPIMLGQLGQLCVGLTDNLMLGRVGKLEFSAAALSNSIFFLFFPFGLGIMSSLAALVPEANAQNNTLRVQKLFSNGLIVSIILGIFIYILTTILYPVVYYLNQPVEVVSMMKGYTNIMMISFIPMTIFFAFRFTADGLSKTKPAMYALVLGNIVNVIFNYLLIFGKFGFPKMGLEGAALGTLISRISTLLFLLLFFYKNDFFGHFIKNFSFKLFDKNIISDIFRVGIPSFFQFFFEIGAFAAVSFLVGIFGADYIAGNQIANMIINISFLLMSGIMITTTIRTGDALGKKDYNLIRKIMEINMSLVITFMLFMGLNMLIFKNYIPKLFNSDPNVVYIASRLMIVGAFFQLSDAIQMTAAGALKGLQDVKIPTLITFIAYWVIALPLGFFIGEYWELKAFGIWIGLGIGLTFAGIFFIKRFYKILNRKLKDTI